MHTICNSLSKTNDVCNTEIHRKAIAHAQRYGGP